MSGALHFLAAFLAFSAGSVISAQAKSGYFVPMATPFVDAFGNLGFSIGLIGMLLALITLIAAGGLWVLSRTWGFWLATVILVLDLISDLVESAGRRRDRVRVARRAVRHRRADLPLAAAHPTGFAGYPVDAAASSDFVSHGPEGPSGGKARA